MSVIIVSKEKNDILIASDGYCGNGTEKGTCGAKFFTYKSSDIIIGVVGDSRTSDIIQNFLVIPKQKKKNQSYIVSCLVPEIIKVLEKNKAITVGEYNENQMIDNQIIVLYNNDIYTIDESFAVSKITYNEYAIGAGADLVLGALEAYKDTKKFTHEEKIIKAIEISSKYLSVISKPYYIMNFKTKHIKQID